MNVSTDPNLDSYTLLLQLDYVLKSSPAVCDLDAWEVSFLERVTAKTPGDITVGDRREGHAILQRAAAEQAARQDAPRPFPTPAGATFTPATA